MIFVTARDSVTDKVEGLELGADDYLSKPFDPRELLARIDTVLRRRAPASTGRPEACASERFGRFELDFVTRALVSGNERIRCATANSRCSRCSYGIRTKSCLAC